MLKRGPERRIRKLLLRIFTPEFIIIFATTLSGVWLIIQGTNKKNNNKKNKNFVVKPQYSKYKSTP